MVVRRTALASLFAVATTALTVPTPSAPGRSGLLVVGLAGNNGVTLLAGQLANRQRLKWESARDGPKQANCLGCITQVGGLAKRFEFSPFEELAVGGWDVVSTPLGEALYQSRILDYDLVRQVRSEMDAMPVMPGVWDPDFYGETQHATATHIASESTRTDQLQRLRDDIRTFKRERGIGTGHVTVCWSASVERPCEEYATASELLAAIERDDKECVSPSLLYAVAAVLEGCSFVNGGSQNTIQPALVELAASSKGGAADEEEEEAESASPPPYVLGTDFKAGQTKSKTAIVEYLRQLGLRVRTIASYNHLGNNDMRNLLSPKTWKAKARVKTDVFGPWTEEEGGEPIDHKVAVLYTEQMGDEKRDTVEYTSEAFMGCEHTMLTYTRCMDSALCVPLMIDSAILCEYLHKRGAKPDEAAKALAYLFKLNEGAAIGVDPGFFNQSASLLALLEKLPEQPQLEQQQQQQQQASPPLASGGGGGGGVQGRVVCAGLSCVDMMLLRADQPSSLEAIAKFDGSSFSAGGSASNTASALRALGVDTSVLTCVGRDVHGAQLSAIYEGEGIDTSLMIEAEDVSTSLAVLPVFNDGGGRGCWVDLSANDRLTPGAMLGALKDASGGGLADVRALHVGYPHLLQGLQGDELASFLRDASDQIGGRPLRSLDVNGATLGAFGDADGVLGPALPYVDLLHANLEEACHIVGVEQASSSTKEVLLETLAKPLLAQGVGVVAITLGGSGAFVAVSEDAKRLGGEAEAEGVLSRAAAAWRGQSALLPALPVSGELNCNGAGDAFTAGLVAAMLWQGDSAESGGSPLSLGGALRLGLASARQRVDSERRGGNEERAESIVMESLEENMALQ